jgi:hypothetical protein
VEAAAEQEDGYGEAYALHALGTALWLDGQAGPASNAFGRAHSKYLAGGLAAEARRLVEDAARLGAPMP